MTWHSQLFRGEVSHQRLGPVAHAFRYRCSFFAFHLAELEQLQRQVRCFSYNRMGWLRLNDTDYLRGEARPIAQQLVDYLGPERAGQHTCLVTSPRLLNYAFNPVNFHLRMQGDQLLAVVAEVNNTFGDRHVYPLTELQRAERPHCWTARAAKQFHVSPFNDMKGEYQFSFEVQPHSLRLGVDLYRGGRCVLKTWLAGRGVPLTAANLTRHVWRHPLDTACNTMPRILWQAAQLYYRKQLPLHRRPSPRSAQTLIDRDRPPEPHAVI